VGAGNEGLTFIWVPQLFATIPFGRFFLAIFFLALVFAAWSSLIAMIELASRVLMDLGAPAGKAIGGRDRGAPDGGPSALSMECLREPGLRVGGRAHAVGVLLRLRRAPLRRDRVAGEFINTGDSDIHIGAWWDWAIRLVTVQAVGLIGWWLWQVRGEDFAANWNPFETFNIGTVVFQWGIVLGVLVALNGTLVRRLRE
jgi:neurotransmitter:Na+ symporter, NSS family